MSVSIMAGIQAQMSQDCEPDASECWCRGSGWILSDWDSFHQCYYHYKGQPNNESDEWEWEMWFSNQEGDGQFMIIPYWDNYLSETEREEVYWQDYARRLSIQQEDLPF